MKGWLRTGIVTLLGLLLGWVGISLYFWFAQDRFLFFPRPLSPEDRENLAADPRIAPLTLTAADGVYLHGWILRGSGPAPRSTLLYFGGNAEEVSFRLCELGVLPGWTIVAVNYRGYGESGGKPGEKVILADARQLYDEIASRSDIDSDRIAVMGYSLGTGVAASLAANRPVYRVVLVAPYDSIMNLARKYYRFFPVKLLIRNRFDSLSWAPSCSAPLLCVTAGADEVIPAGHSRRLFDAWGGPKRTIVVPGLNHGEILSWPELISTVQSFLASSIH